MVLKQKLVLKNMHRVPRYQSKCATNLVGHFGQYLGTPCIFLVPIFALKLRAVCFEEHEPYEWNKMFILSYKGNADF